jgi:predicted DNA-binding WGR domain protein
VRYENTRGTHYKFYEFHLIPGPEDSNGVDTYAVWATWGRIGTSSPFSAVKKTGNFDVCSKEMGRLIRSRERKGYTKIEKKE